MIRVICRLGEPFWRAMGARLVALDLAEGATVADALDRLMGQSPELGHLLRGEPLDAPQVLGPMWNAVRGQLPVQVFVNSRVVPGQARATTPLADGDRLYLFVPTVGG
ncbi:MAG: MoaD/ThiS family protein [Anaerolineae bacterium]